MSTHVKGSKPGQHSKAVLSRLCQVSACGQDAEHRPSLRAAH